VAGASFPDAPDPAFPLRTRRYGDLHRRWRRGSASCLIGRPAISTSVSPAHSTAIAPWPGLEAIVHASTAEPALKRSITGRPILVAPDHGLVRSSRWPPSRPSRGLFRPILRSVEHWQPSGGARRADGLVRGRQLRQHARSRRMDRQSIRSRRSTPCIGNAALASSSVRVFPAKTNHLTLRVAPLTAFTCAPTASRMRAVNRAWVGTSLVFATHARFTARIRDGRFAPPQGEVVGCCYDLIPSLSERL